MTCFSLTELRPFSTSAACHPTPSRTTCLRIQVCSIRPVVSTSLRYGSSSNRRRLVPLGRGQLSLVSGRQIKGFETATLPELRRIDDRGAAVWYEKALELAREEQWEAARKVFQTTTALYPNLCRAWVSWAQMEKKAGSFRDESGMTVKDFDSCRAVLQAGLERNPTSACLVQAWGLMELQKGNSIAAVKLIDRAVEGDPTCRPLQQWKLYQEARQITLSRPSKRLINEINQNL